MKVLVTGGAGYIGSVLVQMLLQEGHQVRVLDSLLYGGHALLGLYHNENVKFFRGDVRSAETVQQVLEGVQAVVHLAAIVGDPACARQPALAREINMDSSLQLFRLSQCHGVERFVFASTCSNYGKMSDPRQYLTEEAELRPVSLYADTKVAVERALLGAPLDDIPAATILRFATVFGLSPRMRFDLTVNEFIMELLTKRKLLVYDEQSWRPYIHVRDVARAIAMVINAPLDKIRSQVFNVGDTSQNYKKSDLVELIRGHMGEEVEIRYIHRNDDPRDYRVSFDKVNRELDFHITRTVKDGIQEIMEAIAQGVITDFENLSYRN